MSAPSRYSPLSISLHWLTLLLLVVVYTTAELKGFFPRESATMATLKMLHSSCGLTVLVLAVLRLGARLAQHAPGITPAPAAWETRLAQLMHVALYALVIGLPLLAWFGINAAGGSPRLWGLPLPVLSAENKALAKSVLGAHKLIANIGYGLIGLHALAALRHHYIRRDDTLLRMLPARN
ncbi:cytochrome b [Castellaniella caeni]|uniref:cytochrome b n=1 Tax=Castellaniella caeni TaxID=266123 RepID=UPI00082BD8EA|nr:cytochrome b [Castellaniella caeni]